MPWRNYTDHKNYLRDYFIEPSALVSKVSRAIHAESPSGVNKHSIKPPQL
jgi:hypothetical protein